MLQKAVLQENVLYRNLWWAWFDLQSIIYQPSRLPPPLSLTLPLSLPRCPSLSLSPPSLPTSLPLCPKPQSLPAMLSLGAHNILSIRCSLLTLGCLPSHPQLTWEWVHLPEWHQCPDATFSFCSGPTASAQCLSVQILGMEHPTGRKLGDYPGLGHRCILSPNSHGQGWSRPVMPDTFRDACRSHGPQPVLWEGPAFTLKMPNIRKRGRVTGIHDPRATADRLEEHKAKLESKKYLKEVGCVYSVREESEDSWRETKWEW